MKFAEGSLVVDSKKTGFIGLLLGLKALLGIYKEYVEKSILVLIPVELNQDHVDLFFSFIGSHGGYNNNPTTRQFTSAYKKIIIDAEIRDGGAGNYIPLVHINILNITSCNKLPEQITNESVANRIFDEFEILKYQTF